MTEDKKPLIELRDVAKVFLTEDVETHALDHVHFRVHSGEWVAVTGPSGSGKSSLLAILGLLDSPTSGAYLLDGVDVSGLSSAVLAHARNKYIGFVFQTFNLIGEMTVFENVELPLVYRGLPAKERRVRVERALERVGMGHRVRHVPAQLSGGQQQRVAVARALVHEPSVVLADEPTGNLDSKNGRLVMDLLRELNRSGVTVCMVTHDPTFAEFASRVVHMLDGRMIDDARDVAAA